MSRLFLFVFCLIMVLQATLAQVAFPERMDIDKAKVNLAGRVPLYSPTRCPKNELLYPGDQKDDWICDCAPGALYYPESDACFPAFRQGPCAAGEFLVLGNSAIVPECLKNECKIDGQVQILNVCYELGKAGPCPNAQLSDVLGVDAKTLHVDCVKQSVSFESRFGNEKPAQVYDLCPRGCKRAVQGRCPETQ